MAVPHGSGDSLELIERLMALGEWLDENALLTAEERARIIGEIQLRLDNDELWDDSDDDDALAILESAKSIPRRLEVILVSPCGQTGRKPLLIPGV